MSNKTYNSPEEVAADLPEEIAKNYLATVGTLSFQTPHTLFEGVRRAYFNSPHIYGNYWIDVLKRVRAGEFGPKGEEPKYPIGGYAPGNYTNTCSTCGKSFMGDKLARQCEPCAVDSSPIPTLDQIKDEVAKECGWRNWSHMSVRYGYGDPYAIDTIAKRFSAHERQRAERAEKEVERLKNMLQTSASFLRLGNGADPGKVTHLLEEIGDTLAQEGANND